MNLLDILMLWFTLALVLTGVGLWTTRGSLMRAFWQGWALTLLTLQAANLFTPITDVWRVVVFAVGFAGIWRERALVYKQVRGVPRWQLAALIMAAVYLAGLSLGDYDPVRVGYDTALYHWPNLQYVTHYAAMPGLANVHGRLAFGNAFSFYPALFTSGAWAQSSYAASYGLLYGALLATIWNTRHETPLLRRAAMWLIPLTIFQATHYSVGLLVDPVVWTGGVLLLIELLRRETDARWVGMLAGLLIAMKFSAVIFAGGVLGWVAWRARKLTPLAWAAFGVIPAVARSIIVSGYLIYPIPTTALPLSWRVPLAWTQNESDWIWRWARFLRDGKTTAPMSALGVPDTWILQTLTSEHWSLFLLPIVLTLILIGLFLQRRRWQTTPLMLAGIGLPSVAFWFITAPAVRFAGITLWVIPLALLLAVPRSRGLQIVVAGLLWLAVFPLPAPQWSATIAPFPAGDYRVTLVEGYPVYSPANRNQCWDVPLPCVDNPERLQFIHWREPGNIQAGFIWSES